jgi:crotonobetainyl-CoA:carnitine CoA-transferase CaiB-like acyl-CoA transferase
MADVGADVIKIEPPAGEHSRSVVPIRDGHSVFYGLLNAGKRSVVLDLRNDDGCWAARELVESADVVVENFRPGVMAKYGLDYKTVSARHPSIVYCSISGYGQDGPWADWPAVAQVVHAASGYDLALLAAQDQLAKPLTASLFPADALGGALAFGGVLTALRARDATGVGRQVDVALVDAILSLMTSELAAAQFPDGYHRRTYPPFRTQDGFVMIAAVNQRNFEAMARALGRSDLIDDPRFRTNPLRWQNSRDLEAIVEAWTVTRTADEVERIMLQAGAPAARYRTISDALQNDQFLRRGTFVQAEDAAGRFSTVDAPFHLRAPDELPADEPVLHVPKLGQHTAEILTEILGADIARKVIASGGARASN